MTVLEAGTTFAGKYLIDGVLGKGGMGAVYSATNRAIGRRVAIKVLIADLADRDDVLKRFELEARAAAVINHPGIVDVLDMGETDDGEPFIVMEYLEGATLKAVYKKHGVFAPAEAVGIISPLLDALAAAHTANVIHRDIKPANIFLCTRPQRLVKLLDFGISRFGQSTGLTHSGTAVGTPKYMAPEQVLGQKTLGPGADLYSVGAVLYELLGGRAPYDADSDIATLAKLLKEEHDPLGTVRPDLPAKLCAFVDSLLVKEPERRPRDATKVKESLQALVKPGDLSTLYDIAQEAGARTVSGGTPRPPSGPARLPGTSPGRRSSVAKTPAAQTMDEEPAPRSPARRAKTPPPSQRSATSLESVDDAPPASRSGLVIGVAIAAVGLIVGAGLFLALGKSEDEPVVVKLPAKASEPPDRTPKAPEPPKPAVPVSVAVTLKAEPPSTRFEVDGEKLEGNPVTVTREKGTSLSVIASAQGHEARTLNVSFDVPREETFTLERLVAAAGGGPAQPDGVKQPKEPKTGRPPPTGKKGGKLTVDETNPYE
ncbi:MAG: protein kinase [Myxococcaceae bacterium]|nr:protein kinase [Myxococcaceae bacterium]